ncbi:ankyrin repeat domain-containing protein [Luteolibacter arcticus]|uniref:Ankyrin repeat domain-containing protein n=1 Tax=Luteolibacter arcticus TaxID=1581411 RepID=A0ABT3GF69_9BACT|nr:ankyrin repeat domain-containing protein [Luteolibacter arcticus]MCW1922204.1 ankyrin repeat domain-containing protein [Luteolibacter arcticus]
MIAKGFFGIWLALSTPLPAEGEPAALSREEALKLARSYDGRELGSLWFDHGDKAGPYRHAGRVVLSPGAHISYEVGEPGKDLSSTGLYVDDDVWETHLDFFTGPTGAGWVTAHNFKPEVAPIVPRSRKDTRTKRQMALGPAGALAIEEGNLELLKVLLAQGLELNGVLDLKDRMTPLYAAVWERELGIAKFLFEKGADPEVRSRSGERPIELAIEWKMDDFIELLAKPLSEEKRIAAVPEGALANIFSRQEAEKIQFIRWQGADPPEELLTWLRKVLPNARAASHMETLGKRPLGAHSWYRDKLDGRFGSLLEVKIEPAGGSWKVHLRDSVGPFLAGGGWEAEVFQQKGYWFRKDEKSWAE